MYTVSILRRDVRKALRAESTNVSRSLPREDGAQAFDSVVIDEQADSSLDGSWNEACAKLSENVREFVYESFIETSLAEYTFKAQTVPAGTDENIKMYIVDSMMADWCASVLPGFVQRYTERRERQMNDLLRKLYWKNPPV